MRLRKSAAGKETWCRLIEKFSETAKKSPPRDTFLLIEREWNRGDPETSLGPKRTPPLPFLSHCRFGYESKYQASPFIPSDRLFKSDNLYVFLKLIYYLAYRSME